MTQFGPVIMPSSELQDGIKILKKRQRRLTWWSFITVSLLIATLITGFVQHDLVYGFFGLHQDVKHLHLPMSVEHIGFMNPEQDYFMDLLIWLAWLIFKVCISFVGAFLIVHMLKKIRFFYVRFQSFVLKFVGWLIAFMVLWSGLTYVQYDLKDNDAEFTQILTSYSNQIQDSQIYQALDESQTPKTVQAYVLAQTALLQKPADVATAQVYLQQLKRAEQQDPQFQQYGLDVQQLWTMQQQVYNQAVTASTKALAPKVQHAQQRQAQFAIVLIISGGVWLMLSTVFWLTAKYFKRRIQAIEQRLM